MTTTTFNNEQDAQKELFRRVLHDLRQKENEFLLAGNESMIAYNNAIEALKGRHDDEMIQRVDGWLKKTGVNGDPTIKGKKPFNPTGQTAYKTTYEEKLEQEKKRDEGKENNRFLDMAWMKFFLAHLEKRFCDEALALEFIQSFEEDWQKKNAQKYMFKKGFKTKNLSEEAIFDNQDVVVENLHHDLPF